MPLPDLTPAEDTLEPVETWPIARLRALQTERMRWTLRHAYERVPHYKRAFDDARVHPDDFVRLEDLARFPFTTRQDLRDTCPFAMFAVPRERMARIHASSGTTFKPIVVGYTQQDIDTWAAVMARSLRAAGVRAGWAVHAVHGCGLFTGGLGAHYGTEKHGCALISSSGGQTGRQVELITDLRPEAIIATPSHILAILEQFRAAGIDPRESSLKVGILGAQPWTNAMRAEIEDAFDMHAVDIYGVSGVMGPGVAQECVEAKDGLHIWEDHFYPEVINPKTGEVLPDGAEGELVFTTLTRAAMPVIRYRTRDLSRLLPGTARTMRRMQRIASD
ncbi:MAG: AMP-binding protein [Acetobacteraceae bacterium]|nr:AMP-binding protein [Acetobacteraceae bacterium]